MILYEIFLDERKMINTGSLRGAQEGLYLYDKRMLKQCREKIQKETVVV